MVKRLTDIGEFEFIKRISQGIKLSSSVVKGIGDDCAVVKYTRDKYLLLTTDMIIEDIHFKRKTAPAEAVGHKALAVNISDIAACGGIPKWAVVSAGIPAPARYDYIGAVFTGIKRLAGRFKIDIVGGDTNLSEKLTVSIALIGEVRKRELTLRSGAEDKDTILLSGPLTRIPDHLTFTPRLKEARYLVENFKVNAMIDISDGFLSDLNHILEESKAGAIIYESLIPHRPKADSIYKLSSRRVFFDSTTAHPEDPDHERSEGEGDEGSQRSFTRFRSFRMRGREKHPDPSYKLLNTGEQFELIFTLPRTELKRLPRRFYTVGEIVKGIKGIIYVTREGRRRRILPEGYKHF